VKILFVSNIFPPHVRGGYELACLELAEKYTSLGHSVIIASSENCSKLRRYPEPIHMDVRRIFAPVRYYDEKYNSHFQSERIYLYERVMAFAGYVEANCIALKRLIEAEEPDLIWIFNPLGIGPIGILDVAVSSGKKVVVHLMDYIDGVILDYSGTIDLTAKWKTLKSKVASISCSKKILESSSLGGKYYSNQVVYNWIQMNTANEKNLPYPLENNEEKSSRRDNSLRMIYFGQIAEKKGIRYLYKLAQKISKSQYRDQITIDLYGKGEDEFIDSLKEGISEDPYLSKVFTLKGFIDKSSLMRVLPNYNLAIFPLSTDEPFGFAPIEAMNKGIPVMVTEIPIALEVFQDKYDAILLPDRTDISEIYQKVIWCLNNPEKVQEIKQNAIKTIKQYFDLDTVTIPAFNEVISNAPQSQAYSFDYILATCETLKYPYSDFYGIAPLELARLKSIRYKFIDLLVNYIYRLPIINKQIPKYTKALIRYYRNIQ
jgi:glycogen synthase